MCFATKEETKVKKGYGWKIFRLNKNGGIVSLMHDTHLVKHEDKWYESTPHTMGAYNQNYEQYNTAFSFFASRATALKIAQMWANGSPNDLVIVARIQYADATLQGCVKWTIRDQHDFVRANTFTRLAEKIRIVPNSCIYIFAKQHKASA